MSLTRHDMPRPSTSCPGLSLLAVVAILAPTVPSPVSAQTFTACRVPEVGAIYMIGVPGTPTACLDPSHVEFSWSESGQVADGAVTTDKIADDAVTASKIADDQITSQHILPEGLDGTSIAANSIGSAELRSNSVGLFEIQSNAVGPDELGLVVVTESGSFSTSNEALIVVCPVGKRVIAGGYRALAMSPFMPEELTVTQNGIFSDTEWLVRVDWHVTPSIWGFEAFAICIIDGS